MILFVVGLFAMVKARKIQEWARKSGNWPFQDYVESPTYIWQQRIAVAVLMSFFFAYAAYLSR